MLITLMFSAVAMKSRTFSGFSLSANEQLCSTWEGAWPGSQPKLANENIPYHKCHTQFMKGVGQGRAGSSLLFSCPRVQILSCPGVRTFPGVWFFSGVL